MVSGGSFRISQPSSSTKSALKLKVHRCYWIFLRLVALPRMTFVVIGVMCLLLSMDEGMCDDTRRAGYIAVKKDDKLFLLGMSTFAVLRIQHFIGKMKEECLIAYREQKTEYVTKARVKPMVVGAALHKPLSAAR